MPTASRSRPERRNEGEGYVQCDLRHGGRGPDGRLLARPRRGPAQAWPGRWLDSRCSCWHGRRWPWAFRDSHARRHLARGPGAVRRSFLRQRAQRQGHRLEPAGLAAARGRRLPGWPPSWAYRRALPSVAMPRCAPCSRPSSACAAGVAAGLAAAGPVVVQGRQSGRHLGDLHLFHLAHDRQYRRWGDARAAGLPERGARAESVGMEGRHQGIAAGGAALCADRRAIVHQARPGW